MGGESDFQRALHARLQTLPACVHAGCCKVAHLWPHITVSHILAGTATNWLVQGLQMAGQGMRPCQVAELSPTQQRLTVHNIGITLA